jgi:hypothetical protein
VLVSIWLPVWEHYHVVDPELSEPTVLALRTNPPDMRLLALDNQARKLRIDTADPTALRQAEAIARGQFELPGGEIRHVGSPFDPGDYVGGSPGGDLSMASLVVADTLLRAYDITGTEAYFEQAKHTVLGFDAFERGLLTDVGLVRNDHAIAARVGVLIRFWRLYRHRADFDEAVAGTVLQQVARCAEFLAKPSHFTAATNHGVMQNIALLQAAVAFPALPGTASWKSTAYSRLSQQLAFFVNGEGVVLEHSPGYHRFGTDLMAMVLELLEWNKMPAIEGLSTKYMRSVAFLHQLLRPDGSVPRIGDTNGQGDPAASTPYPVSRDEPDAPAALLDATKIYPSAGYAITRRPLSPEADITSVMSHATLYWSHFPGHGHEVAAEGSFVLWAAGTDWLSNTGYWPYGLRGEGDARGWRGSNAPHIAGESTASVRSTELLAYGADQRSHLLDLRRTLAAGPRLRRQVVQISETSWFVLDSLPAPLTQSTIRLWTLAPNLVVTALDRGQGLVAKDPATGWSLTMEFLSESALAVRQLRGSFEPFGGWVVDGPRPLPTTAFEVSQGPGARWVAVLVSLSPSVREPRPAPPVFEYRAEDDWSLTADSFAAASEVRRRGNRLEITQRGEPPRYMELVTPAPKLLDDQRVIQRALGRTTAEFQRFRPYLHYRTRLTYAVVAIGLASLLAWAGIRRRARRWSGAGLALASVFWAATAAWIHLRYLVG